MRERERERESSCLLFFSPRGFSSVASKRSQETSANLPPRLSSFPLDVSSFKEIVPKTCTLCFHDSMFSILYYQNEFSSLSPVSPFVFMRCMRCCDLGAVIALIFFSPLPLLLLPATLLSKGSFSRTPTTRERQQELRAPEVTHI